jgi:UDP-N-acetylmuramate dehydrogenase
MKVIEKFSLENYNGYHLKSFCSLAIFPENENDIYKLLTDKNNKSAIIIGHGSNIILSKEWYDQPFIIFNGNLNWIKTEGPIITVGTGASLAKISICALENELTGFESFFDIPGSLGGAIFMNAGTQGSEIKDSLIKVKYFDKNDYNFKEIATQDIGFDYRSSIFQKQTNHIIIEAEFELTKGESSAIESAMNEIKHQRWLKQPRDYPNCGSVFKRPAGHFIGPLLDELGLKGSSIGDAKVSEKHSGFIINTGNARGSEILELIDLIREKVKDRYQIMLEVEQKIV